LCSNSQEEIKVLPRKDKSLAQKKKGFAKR
jgi:hypothetical protein